MAGLRAASPPVGGSRARPTLWDRVSPQEAVDLGATDPLFYARYFFPKTVRQASPKFHEELWHLYETPHARYCAAEVFRGGAKTTLFRLFASRRIAYALSRTILFVGVNQAHPARSVEWLIRAVKFNSLWAQAFGLRVGSKWTGTEIDIYHGIDEVPVRVLAFGILGGVRGINIDDYRPDLIIGDDIIDDESAASEDQRIKTVSLWFGAIKESLAPRSENPGAKQLLGGTPIDKGDVNELCQSDPEWRSVRRGIFDENGHSVWPERWTTEELIKEKQAAIARNQLSIWLREKECQITAQELCDFRPNWLKFYDGEPLPERMEIVMGIDPVPPPTELQLRNDLRKKDWEVLSVVGRAGSKYYLLDYRMNQGHTPEWTLKAFWELVSMWRPRRIRVETVAYQQTLKWLIEKSMAFRRQFIQINEQRDKRKKRDRVLDGLHGPTSQGVFYCSRHHTAFIEQFERHPRGDHDDVIESVAIAMLELSESEALEEAAADDGLEAHERRLLEQHDWQSAP